MMQLGMPNFELWDMNVVAHELDTSVTLLEPLHGFCLQCADAGRDCPIPPLALAAFDSDAAFENVKTADAELAFEILASRYLSVFGDPWLSVGLGRRCDVRSGVRQWASGRWNISIDTLRPILWAGLRLQLSVFGTLVVQQFGQSIGGVMAKIALSLVSGVLEGLWIACPSIVQLVGIALVVTLFAPFATWTTTSQGLANFVHLALQTT
jgi:hypothetical protein